MTSEARLREATPVDVATIVRHRRLMFREMGHHDETALDAMEATSTPFLRAGLEDGSYRGWLVETDAGVLAGGGLLVVGYPSHPRDPHARRAWILNMYTEPAARGRGHARAILEAMIRWCRERGFASVSLHASDAERHLYETMGFAPTNEMRLDLR